MVTNRFNNPLEDQRYKNAIKNVLDIARLGGWVMSKVEVCRRSVYLFLQGKLNASVKIRISDHLSKNFRIKGERIGIHVHRPAHNLYDRAARLLICDRFRVFYEFEGDRKNGNLYKVASLQDGLAIYSKR